jgi:hypothetical protein
MQQNRELRSKTFFQVLAEIWSSCDNIGVCWELDDIIHETVGNQRLSPARRDRGRATRLPAPPEESRGRHRTEDQATSGRRGDLFDDRLRKGRRVVFHQDAANGEG